MLIILALGFTSGLSLPLVFSTLSYWLSTIGIDKTTIAYFISFTAPYNLKFIWSPLLDKVKIPYLTKKLGQKRSWLIACQFLLIIAICFLGMANPLDSVLLTAIGVFILSFVSASYDIVVDGFRIELLEENEYGEGSAAGVNGYRIGMLVSGAGALFLSDYIGWFLVYYIMAGFVIIGTIATLLASSISYNNTKVTNKPSNNKFTKKILYAGFMIIVSYLLYRFGYISGFISYLIALVSMCILWFPKKPIPNLSKTDWILIILLIALYKFSDAFAGTMMNTFYVELGFSGTEIASITKVFGLIATLIGAFIGGYAVSNWGLYKGLLIGAILQMLSNLVFIEQARLGHNVEFLAVTIAIENLSGGFGTTAFVAFISKLCGKTAYTATNFALLTSISGLGRTILSSSSGGIIDYYKMSWESFFLITALTGIPVLIILIIGKKTGCFPK